MSNSIFKEVTFTPQAFEKEFNLSNRRRFTKLILILESLIDSGIIITASSNWKEKVLDFIEKYENDEKDDISSLLKEIDDRQRIMSYPSHENYDNEEEWIEKISLINNKSAFDFIAGTKNKGIVQIVESIERENYKYTGAIVAKQTELFMQNMLAPILSYAEIVKVFDPYFSLIPTVGNKERFKKSLELICENLCNKHGKKNKATIEIHTSIKSMMNNFKQFVWQYTSDVPKILKYFEQKYDHTITINIWEEVKKENEWHERWIITNQCGVSIGKGSDISDWTDSTWGLLNWENIPEIEGKFNKNRNTYNFIGEINSSNVIKNQNPHNTLTYMTEKEKKVEKANQEIRIKKKLEDAENKLTKNKKIFNKNTKKWEFI